MKQLLHTASGSIVVVGLRNRAFTGRLDAGDVVELEPSPPALVPVAVKHSGTNDSLQRATDTKTKAHYVEGSEKAAASPQPGTQTVETVALDEIQAVAVHTSVGPGSDTAWYCAVARYDKTLTVYHVLNGKARIVSQHRTGKRASSLVFATVSATGATPATATTTSQSLNDLTVVIAGDLAGDATAFPLELDQNVTVDVENPPRRVLLGHTASMLTAVKVVPSHDAGTDEMTNWILTADRDEKIRISSFPATHDIQSFLLGHEAFVSDIDANDRECVSVGGDGTIRYWDISTGSELATLTCTESSAGRVTIPVKVSFLGKDQIAVIYDESTTLDILSVTRNVNVVTLTPLTQISVASQPLAIDSPDDHILLLLAAEPLYLQAFAVVRHEHRAYSLESQSWPFLNALRTSVAEYGPIQMHTAVLERDEYGRLKMDKLNETRTTNLPWNNVDRREKAKNRNKRQKKRRKQAQDDEYREGSDFQQIQLASEELS
jgi:tRNA (guanine-N(7)-)-methyltransferase subunit TRM82